MRHIHVMGYVTWMCIRAKRKAPAFKQAPDIKIRADYKVLRNDSILSKATAVLIRSQFRTKIYKSRICQSTFFDKFGFWVIVL